MTNKVKEGDDLKMLGILRQKLDEKIVALRYVLLSLSENFVSLFFMHSFIRYSFFFCQICRDAE